VDAGNEKQKGKERQRSMMDVRHGFLKRSSPLGIAGLLFVDPRCVCFNDRDVQPSVEPSN